MFTVSIISVILRIVLCVVRCAFDIVLQDTLVKLQEERAKSKRAVGLDLTTGDAMLPEQHGIWDYVCVKRQMLQLSTIIATQLLLVDEVIKAGKNMGKG